MNYRHVYMLIIEHAKSEEKLGIRAKGNGNYYEAHHILPRSLFPLWENRKSNIVLLTFREHFFCHQLLSKIYPYREMQFALMMLGGLRKKYRTEWGYSMAKKQMSSWKEYSSQEKQKEVTEKQKFTLSEHRKDENFEKRFRETRSKAGKAGNSEEAKEKRRITLSLKDKEIIKREHQKSYDTLRNSEKYEDWKRNCGNSARGTKWYNNGIIEERLKEKPFGKEWKEGRLFRSRPNSQKGGKNSNSTKIINIDTNEIFETMKYFCKNYNISMGKLRKYMKNYNIKREKIIKVSVNIINNM